MSRATKGKGVAALCRKRQARTSLRAYAADVVLAAYMPAGKEADEHETDQGGIDQCITLRCREVVVVVKRHLRLLAG